VAIYRDEAVALVVRVQNSAEAGRRKVVALGLARAGRVRIRLDEAELLVDYTSVGDVDALRKWSSVRASKRRTTVTHAAPSLVQAAWVRDVDTDPAVLAAARV
jgi:hypothetical protein